MKCFRCHKAISGIDEQCSICNWGEHRSLDEDDPRYLVFVNLVYRASNDLNWDGGRLEPTSREFALFQHGDQCCVDGVSWRINARNTEVNVLYVSGWKSGFTKSGRLVIAPYRTDLETAIQEREQEYLEREENHRQREAEADIVLAEARSTGEYLPEHLEFMTAADWEDLTDAQIEDLYSRYDSIAE